MLMQNHSNENDVKNWLREVQYEPIVKALLENSNLTMIQFETILIDFFSSQFSEKYSKIKDKIKLRLKSELSRGSFNRTLKQARQNVVRSIYTILLLGYVGAFESPKLEPFLELANRIKSHVDEGRKMGDMDMERSRLVEFLRGELRDLIEDLATNKYEYKT